MMSFPSDWYWIADDGRVYSSARQVVVDTNDAGYIAWSQSTRPTVWPRDLDGNQTDDALQDVLTPYNLFVDLATYAAFSRFNLASGGMTIAGHPYLTDPVSRNTVGSANDYAVANPGHITDWKLADGTFIQLDQAELAHVLQQMATFVQSCFTCESTTLTAINGGTITTQAQVDAAFAAISNVFP